MAADDLKARIVERVKTRSAERHLPVLAAAEITGDATLGPPDVLEEAVHELLRSGALAGILAGGGVFLSVGTERDEKRRPALDAITTRVLADMAGRGSRLEQLVAALRIVDTLQQ